MSENKDITFDFDKFNIDLDKRTNENINQKIINDDIKNEDIKRRRRNELYNEKWQNTIRWSEK